jgi:hypothetical protein
MINTVYSNSCSFGAPLQGHKIYPDYIAEKFNADLVNQGVDGSCNRRIIRNSLRDLIELSASRQNILALIGLSFVSRTELWQPDLPAADRDGHFHSIIVDHNKISWKEKGLIETIVPNISELARPSVKEYYKQWLLHLSLESEVTNLLTDLIMFTGWARSKKIDYLVFCNTNTLPGEPQVGLTSPFVHSLHQTVSNDKNIIDLWQFSFKDYALSNNFIPKDSHVFGIHGHPNADAHRSFADFLTNNFLPGTTQNSCYNDIRHYD